MEALNDRQRVDPETNNHKRNIFVVLNPVAGLTQAGTTRQTIEDFCQNQGWECEIHETSLEDDLREVVNKALKNDIDLVIAAGGDGTVSGVVSGMVNKNKPMAILPGGTGNALARDLHIPLDLSDALNLLAAPNRIQSLDVMEINKADYFVLNVSIGITSMTMRKTAREDKRRFGMLAYAWRAAGTIVKSDMHRFVAQVDDHVYRFAASEVMIANSRLLGLNLQLGDVVVDPNDGKLDLFVVRARSTVDYLGVLTRFLIPRSHDEEKKIDYLAIRDKIRLESEFPLPVQADGEDIGITPLEIRLIPSALQVIVPA